MPASATTRARPRAFWADARFFLGLVLIVASVAGVWLVVSAARATSPALVAAHTIVPGEVIAADDLRVVDVSLGQTADVYLTSAPQGEVVAARTIEEGELVASSAVVPADAVATTTVVVSAASDIPAAVDAGSVVEVWAAVPDADGVVGEPRVLVPDAVVARVSRDDAVLGQNRVALELVIARSDVATVLASTAAGASISVIPLGVGAR